MAYMTQSKHPAAKDLIGTVFLAVSGIALYIPAAIGLAVAELRRKPEADTDQWRFIIPGISPGHLVSIGSGEGSRQDLWSRMNLRQYFTLLPGPTALPQACCAYSRPCGA